MGLVVDRNRECHASANRLRSRRGYTEDQSPCYCQLFIVTRRRSSSFAEYCKHFVARLNDVHAFGCNSAGSERIWMKFREPRDYGLELSLTNFGRDPRRSGSGRASRIFVFFCPLNNARFHRLPVGQISRNFHKKTCFREFCGAFGKHL